MHAQKINKNDFQIYVQVKLDQNACHQNLIKNNSQILVKFKAIILLTFLF